MSEFKVGDKVYAEVVIIAKDTGVYEINADENMKNPYVHFVIPEKYLHKIPKKTYEDGLNEAWELAREIYKMDGPTLEGAFGTWDGAKIFCLPFHEAMDKVEKWKDEKAIHVNDVVEDKELKLKGLITSADDNGDDLHILWENGKRGRLVYSKDSLEKTGRTIDVESILNQIGGAE